MTARVTAVVMCGGELHAILQTVQSIKAAGTAAELVLVGDPTTPAAADEWLSSLEGPLGTRFLRVDSATPGSVRNAGVAAGTAALAVCVDAGDRLAPGYLEEAVRRFDGSDAVALVTSGLRQLFLTSRTDTIPDALDLETLTAAFDTAHAATVFTRCDWDALGGFDERLVALEDTDFWLRALALGRLGVVLDRVPLIRTASVHRRYRQALDESTYGESVSLLIERHEQLFQQFVASALERREHRLFTTAQTYRDTLARRDSLVDRMSEYEAAIAVIGKDPGSLPDPGKLAHVRTTPLSGDWGYDRGVPVDRHYIEQFLERHAGDIRGAVLEVQEADYTRRFGADHVSRSEVVDINAGNPAATIIGDLRCLSHVRSDQFDCIILTQTVHVIDDMRAVVFECRRLLRPGGVLLATLPCASRVCLEYGVDGDFWRVTEAGARVLFESSFGPVGVDTEPMGNVMATTAFLQGRGQHEVTAEQFAFFDPYHPTLVGVRAVKQPARTGDARRGHNECGDWRAILLYHRINTPESDVHGLSVPPQIFRQQMAQLRDRSLLVSLEDLVGGTDIPRGKPRIAVTFDDGYADNLFSASDVLVALGIPATFFVTTADPAGTPEYWWDTLERALLSPGQRQASLEVIIAGESVTIDTQTVEARRRAHDLLYNAIAPQAVNVRDTALAEIVAWARVPIAEAVNRRLSVNEVRELASRPGHSIGAHTVNHPMLIAQPRHVVAEELESSRVTLEQLTGRRVSSIAYPFGAWNLQVASMAARAGYRFGVTCEPVIVTPGSPPMTLPRFDVVRGGFQQITRLFETPR